MKKKIKLYTSTVCAKLNRRKQTTCAPTQQGGNRVSLCKLIEKAEEAERDCVRNEQFSPRAKLRGY